MCTAAATKMATKTANGSLTAALNKGSNLNGQKDGRDY